MKRLLITVMAAAVTAVAMAGNGLNPQFLKWRKMKAAGMLPQQREQAKPAPAPTPAPKKMKLMAAAPKAAVNAVGGDTSVEIVGLAPEAASLGYLVDLVGKPIWKPVDGYPSKFDLRDSGCVTAVRNQGLFETCWAFASFASLESSILVQRPETESYTAADIDFSERHMVDNHGFDLGPKQGGSMLMAMAYLLRWGGPVGEATSPYPAADVSEWTASSATADPRLHVQQVRWLPGKSGSLDNDTIKESVLSLGGVFVTFYMNKSLYYNSSKAAYCCQVPKTENNHGVTIVGWDDDYPASNFNALLIGNGAYLCKNSYGPTFGDNGYFWVSYYDANFARSPMAVFNGCESKANYATIYQYDPLGYTGEAHAGGSRLGKAWMANVYTAERDDQIAAVGFYALAPKTSYSIRIYTEVTGDPSTGTLRDSNTQPGETDFSGFVTIPLDKVVPVRAGTKFAVCVYLYSPGLTKPLAMESPVAGYSSKAEAASGGQSYYSSTVGGTKWYDLAGSVKGANFCVKAYGIADKDEIEHKMEVMPTGLEVTGPTVIAAGESGTYATAMLFDDNSRWDGQEIEYEILSGASALSADEKSGNELTLTVRKDLAEDTKVAVRISATDEELTGITVRKEFSFTATKAIPPAPADFTATAGTAESGVRLAWSEVKNAASYAIYRSTSEDAKNATFLASVEGTKYTDLTAAPGVDYVYFAKSQNSSGSSAFSAGAGGWRKLAAPADLAASDGDFDFVQLSWSPAEGANFYRVFRATDMDADGNPVDPVAITEWIETCGFQDTPPEKGVNYFYWVKSALSFAGYRESDYSIFDPGSRKAPVSLSAVQIEGAANVAAGSTAAYTLTATLSNGSRLENVSNVSWTCSLDGKPVKADKFEFEALVNGLKVASDTLVTISAEWTYENEDGKVTKSDSKLVVIAPVVPDKPNAVKVVEATTEGVKVAWIKTEGASSYNLYRGESPEKAELLVSTDGFEFTDTKVIPGATYRYWLEAVNSAGASPKSDASAEAMRQFTPPIYVTASNGTSIENVAVSWRAVTGARYYRVSRADTPDGEKHDLSGWIAGRAFEDKTAVPGETYWYFVEAAYDVDGGSASALSVPTVGKKSAAQTLAFIEVSGPSSIQYDSQGSYVCTAVYANGVQKRVNSTWSFKKADGLVTVNSDGVVSAGHVTGEDLHLELQASFTDNGITCSDSVSVTIIAWRPVQAQVFVSNVVVRARWPWNGIVDISYDLYSVPATARAVVTVVGYDHDLNETLQAVTLTGDGADYPAAGGMPHKDCRVSWNLGADYPNFHASAFSVSLDVAPFAVAAPADFRASDNTSTNGVELSWEEAFGAEKYVIYRSLGTDIKGAEMIASVSDGTAYTDSEADYGETYYYWIKTSAGPFMEDVSTPAGPVAGKRLTPPYAPPVVNLQDGLVAYYRNDEEGWHNLIEDSPASVEGDFTFACWVKTEKDGTLAAEQLRGIATGCNFILEPDTNGVNCGLSVLADGVNIVERDNQFLPAILRQPSDFSDDWHFVAFTVEDNGAPILYIDGVYARTGLDSGKLKTLLVNEPSAAFEGDLDHACFYGKTLTAEEIAALCEAGTPMSEDKPVSAKPTVDVAYADGTATVTISCTEHGAGTQPTVYYSIIRNDGGDTVESREYTVPFTVEGSATVIAWSVKDGYYNSPRVKVAVKADWKVTAAETLGGEGAVAYDTFGDCDWVFDPSESSDEVPGSMRSGRIGAGGASAMSARVTGEGTFAFDWRVSSEADFDFLVLTVDGETAHKISGEVGWHEVVLELTNDTPHVITWVYTKDGGIDRGRDCGWVDFVTWAPAGSMVDAPIATATPLDGGASNRIEIACAKTPGAAIQYKVVVFGEEGEWTDYEGPFVFEGDGEIYMKAKKQGFVDSFVSKAVVRRSWLVRAGEALLMDEVTRREVSLFGDYFEYGTDEEFWWDQDRTVVSDGTWASMKSPKLRDATAEEMPMGIGASMYGKVTGAGTLYFDRKVDSEAGWDVLTYYAGDEDEFDYTYADAISGDRDWERVKLVFKYAGDHVIEWEYNKDDTGKDGRDAGWIDFLKWVPARYVPTAPEARTGYTFGGYTAAGRPYEPGAMLDAEDEASDFEPVWSANHYTLRYEAQPAAEDSKAEQEFVYDQPQNLLAAENFVFARGYAFAGWTTTEGGAVEYADGVEVGNLAAEQGAEVVLRPVLNPITYTVRFAGEGVAEQDVAATFDVDFTFPSLERQGFTFDGWAETEGGEVKYAPGATARNVTATQGAVVVFYAKWTVIVPKDPIKEALAVEDPSIQFTTGGDEGWFAQGDVKVEGDAALRSGKIHANQSSILETYIFCPIRKRISFWWKVSCEKDWDNFAFFINDAEKARISGLDGDWMEFTAILNEGTNHVRWVYSKDDTGDRGEDCGWLDKFTVRDLTEEEIAELEQKEQEEEEKHEEDVREEAVFKVIQYTISKRPYTVDDALAATNTPSIWMDDPVTGTYPYINFGDNVTVTTHFPSSRVSFPGNAQGGRKATYYACQVTGRIYVPEAGKWTFACGSDDGFRCTLSNADGWTDSFEYYKDRSYGTTLKTFNFPKAGVYNLYLIYFEYGDNSILDLSCAKGSYSSFSVLNGYKFKLVGTPESGVTLVGKGN